MKILRLVCAILVAVAGVFLLALNNAHAQFDESAKWVPQSANTIMMVRSKKILESPIAVANKWKSERAKAFRSGAGFIPPSMKRMLIASQLDFQFMETIWNVAVFEDGGDKINIVNVSKRVGGNLETIGDKKAVVLPSDAYLVQVDDRTLVSMAPANRQMTSRWLRSSQSGTANLSPYLMSAIKFADDNADVIIALDLDRAVSEKEISEHLKAISAIDQNNVEVYTKVLSTLQGVTLGITVRDKITGAIKIDFNESPAVLGKDGKTILLNALKENGLMIDDLENWTMTASDKQLLLSGALTQEGLRHVGTLIKQPLHHDFVQDGSDSSDTGEPEVNMATRTQQYFADIQHITESLRKKDLNNLRTYARWFDRYSREIDQLSILGVDEVMVQYGAFMGNSFRDVANSLRGSDLDRTKNVAKQRSYANYYSTGYGANFNRYGRWGGYARNVNQRNRQIASNLGTQAGANEAKSIMSEVEAQTAAVRQAMAQKYKVDF